MAARTERLRHNVLASILITQPPLADYADAHPIIVAAVVLWFVSILVASSITERSGRGGSLGAALGFSLSWIGVAIALLLEGGKIIRVEPGAPAIEGHGQPLRSRVIAFRECPHCKERMRCDAHICPHCRNESAPWTLRGSHWWCKIGDDWYFLNAALETWQKWDFNSAGEPASTSSET